MSEWISVKDRLPENDCYKKVLVHLVHHGIYIRWFANGLFFSKQYDAFIYCTYRYPAYAKKALKTVTHWMPLPEKHKDKECFHKWKDYLLLKNPPKIQCTICGIIKSKYKSKSD